MANRSTATTFTNASHTCKHTHTSGFETLLLGAAKWLPISINLKEQQRHKRLAIKSTSEQFYSLPSAIGRRMITASVCRVRRLIFRFVPAERPPAPFGLHLIGPNLRLGASTRSRRAKKVKLKSQVSSGGSETRPLQIQRPSDTTRPVENTHLRPRNEPATWQTRSAKP